MERYRLDPDKPHQLTKRDFRTPIYVVKALVRAANEDGRTITSLLNKIIVDWLVQKKFLKGGDAER
jgi:hypothetical protein